jgi:uncharacterized protein
MRLHIHSRRVTTKQRAVAWVKDDPFGFEFADISLTGRRLKAVGVAVGTDPFPYRLDYTLETRSSFVTSRLRVTSRGEGWQRTLDLRRNALGVWSAGTTLTGDPPLPPPSRDPASLTGALDCDLGLSPTTNSMPVLRHTLLAGGGSVDFLMAWVSVPDLSVRPSGQRYTFINAESGAFVVRYESTDSGFVADLTFDEDGLVIDYPGIGRRLS